MSRSSAKSGKAVAIQSLKEKWEKSVQSAKVKGKKEIGGSSTVTQSAENLVMWAPIVQLQLWLTHPLSP